MRTLKIYSLKNFQIYMTVLLPIVTMLHLMFLGLIYSKIKGWTFWWIRRKRRRGRRRQRKKKNNSRLGTTVSAIKFSSRKNFKNRSDFYLPRIFKAPAGEGDEGEETDMCSTSPMGHGPSPGISSAETWFPPSRTLGLPSPSESGDNPLDPIPRSALYSFLVFYPPLKSHQVLNEVIK